MIKHIVMWTLKPEANGRSAADNAAEMKARLEGLNGKIPGLKHLEVGVNVFAATPECHAALYSEFGTRADLDAMAQHDIRCFLIGESLMRQPDVEAAKRALVG